MKLQESPKQQKRYKGLLAVAPSKPKLLPQQQAAEEAVLGALLLDGMALVLILDTLPIAAFYSNKHQAIYKAIIELYQQGQIISIITLAEHLTVQEQLESIGGPYQLATLTNRVASSANIEYHARLVKDAFCRRQLIEWAHSNIKQAYREDNDILELLNQVTTELMELSNYKMGTSLLQLCNQNIAQLEQLTKLDTSLGVPLGFPALDIFIGGWQPSDLIVLAARPSMGKTALVLQLAYHAALSGFPVAFFSLEMSALQLTTRLLQQQANISRAGISCLEDRARARACAAQLQTLPLHIDDTAALNLTQLKARCKKLLAQGLLRLIVIDYLQLMTTLDNNPFKNREQEIATISRGLKTLAKELNVPIIALSQLSRSIEKRDNKRPQLSDLRESGSVEQDADLVVFVNRLEQYGILEDEEGNCTKGKADILVAKFRNGATGALPLNWQGKYMKFSEVIQH